MHFGHILKAIKYCIIYFVVIIYCKLNRVYGALYILYIVVMYFSPAQYEYINV
jgi:hypothetical protein